MGTDKFTNRSSKVEPVNPNGSTVETTTEQLPEQYCTVYNDLMALVNTMQGAEVKLINFICLHLSVPSKGVIYLTTAIKERAAKETGYAERSINRAMKVLLNLGVILRMPGRDRKSVV